MIESDRLVALRHVAGQVASLGEGLGTALIGALVRLLLGVNMHVDIKRVLPSET